MPPHKIRNETVKQLRQAVVVMMSSEWFEALNHVSGRKYARAGRVLLETQKLRLSMGNAILADIRDKLIQNEEGLRTGIKELKAAIKNLQQVTKVLRVVERLLAVVRQVVTVAGV